MARDTSSLFAACLAKRTNLLRVPVRVAHVWPVEVRVDLGPRISAVCDGHLLLTGTHLAWLNSVLVDVRPSRNLGKWKGKDGVLEEPG